MSAGGFSSFDGPAAEAPRNDEPNKLRKVTVLATDQDYLCAHRGMMKTIVTASRWRKQPDAPDTNEN
jgi:hypothetical protein